MCSPGSRAQFLAVAVAVLVAAALAPFEAEAHTRPNFQKERRHIKTRAKSQIGAPYRSGGTSPRGFDCSGFTRWVYGGHGARLPHSSKRQFRLSRRDGYLRIWRRKRLHVGDLVFHKTTRGERVGHVGIYIGHHRFISSTTSGGVQVDSIYDPYYWGRRWVGATRPSVTRRYR